MKLVVQHVDVVLAHGTPTLEERGRHTLGAIDVPADGTLTRLDLVRPDGVRYGTLFISAGEGGTLRISKRLTEHKIEEGS